MLAATPPDASDIAAIYTHLATATTANCDDIAEGYTNDDCPHAYLLAVKPSANSDTPYMLPIFGMATFRTDADHNMRGKVLAWTENGGGSEGVPASLVVRGSWLVPGEPFAPSGRLEFDKALVDAGMDLAAEVVVAEPFTPVRAAKKATRSSVLPKKATTAKKTAAKKKETEGLLRVAAATYLPPALAGVLVAEGEGGWEVRRSRHPE